MPALSVASLKNISSMEVTSWTGRTLSTAATISSWTRTYSAGRASTISNIGQRRRASEILVPVRIPYFFAS